MDFFGTGYPFDSANHEEEVVWGGRPCLAPLPAAGPAGRPTWRADEGVRRGPGGPPHKCARQVLAKSNGYPVMKWPALRRWATKTETSSRRTSRPILERRTSWSAASLAQAPAHRYFTLQLAPVEQLAAWYVTRAELAQFQPYFRLFGLLLRNRAAAIDRSLFCWFRHKSIISPDK